MKLFIIGPEWIGAWGEPMQRAAIALGHTASLFYYQTLGLANLRRQAEHRLPPVVHRLLRAAGNVSRRYRELQMNRRLVSEARAFRPDMIIMLKGETVTRATLESLRALRAPMATWWVDDPFRFPNLIPDFELFDGVYMFDKDCIAKLQAMGIKRLVYMPCACDPATFHPQTLDPAAYPALKCTIGFVATYHPTRAALVSQMHGWEVGLWGSGWEGVPELQALPAGTWRAEQITPAEAAKVYNLAPICPNVHHPQTRWGGLNTRTFEVPAAGGFELVDDVPGLEENFEVGHEIVPYTSPAHFRELTHFYLAHPEERAAIAERGRARVLRDHTYEQRLATILRTVAG